MTDLVDHVGDILERCLEMGMQMPFIMCSASPNGSVLCVRFAGEVPNKLAEHYEPEGFRLPVHAW